MTDCLQTAREDWQAVSETGGLRQDVGTVQTENWKGLSNWIHSQMIEEKKENRFFIFSDWKIQQLRQKETWWNDKRSVKKI